MSFFRFGPILCSVVISSVIFKVVSLDVGRFHCRDKFSWWHDDASPNETSLVISTPDYEPLWSVCPKGKTDQWISRPKYFFSLNVASQPIFSLYGDFMTILNFQTMIIILVIVSPFATPMDFYRGKKCQNLNFPYIILQKYLLVRFCNILLRKFASQNML